MQIVIDIPEKIYKHIIFQKLPCQQLPYGLSDMIKNGTPLPKGHGDLIDKNNLITITDISGGCREITYVSYSEIENAPTIIEADIS